MTSSVSAQHGFTVRRKNRFTKYIATRRGLYPAILLKGKYYRQKIREPITKHWLSGKGLEIGPGAHPAKLAENASARFLDYAPPEVIAQNFGISAATANADLIGSMEAIPAEGQSFDFVVACHVLEHLEDPISGIKEALRVLKFDGILFLMVPNRNTSEFDFQRNVLPLEHFVSEHKSDELRESNKLEHYREFIDKSQLPRSDRRFEARVQEYIEADKRIHFHAYSGDLLAELIRFSAKECNFGVSLVDGFNLKYSTDLIIVVRKLRNADDVFDMERFHSLKNSSIERFLAALAEIEDPQSLKLYSEWLMSNE